MGSILARAQLNLAWAQLIFENSISIWVVNVPSLYIQAGSIYIRAEFIFLNWVMANSSSVRLLLLIRALLTCLLIINWLEPLTYRAPNLTQFICSSVDILYDLGMMIHTVVFVWNLLNSRLQREYSYQKQTYPFVFFHIALTPNNYSSINFSRSLERKKKNPHLRTTTK